MVSARSGIRSTTAHVTGLALLFISLGMLLSAVVEYVDGTNGAALLMAATATAVSGAALWWSTRPGALDHATIFTAVGTTWLVASAFGALPYLFAGTFAVAGRPWAVVLADALFESISGYSCTGSTVFGGHNPIGSQGSGVLLYRQLTQWAGGMGIVVLVVTVLPSLRASGLGLIDAEAPGNIANRCLMISREQRQRYAAFFKRGQNFNRVGPQFVGEAKAQCRAATLKPQFGIRRAVRLRVRNTTPCAVTKPPGLTSALTSMFLSRPKNLFASTAERGPKATWILFPK